MGTQLEIAGYRIKDELGRGGMATVYLAVQESVLREVALKVMSPVLRADPSFGERFMREARIAANLHHRHVVAIHDVGVHEDYHYIAMEYLSGGDIKARFRDRMSLADCLRVTSEIADALDYAHAKGFVHRDIKPDNILFREDGSAVLTDFGIARATDSSTQMTRTGAVVGTPHYMSPEQARGRPLDHRSDLYSLGIVFYEMATGRLPYEAGDSLAVGIKHITEPIPALPEKLEALQPFLNKILAKDREQRYQTGASIVADLREMQADVQEALDRPLIVDAPPPPRTKTPVRTVVLDEFSPAGRREPNLGAIDALDPEMATAGHFKVRRSWWPWAATSAVIGPIVLAAAVWYLPGEDGWVQTQWRTWRAERIAARADRPGMDLDRAEALYKQALVLDPNNRRARVALDAIQSRDGRTSDDEPAIDDAPGATVLVDVDQPAVSGASTGVIERGEPEVSDIEPEPEPTLPADVEQPEVDTNAVRIAALLQQAQEAVAAGALVGDRPNTALSHFREVQRLDPDNEAAARGINMIGGRLVELASAAIERGNVERAQRLLDEARVIVPGMPSVREADARLTSFLARNALVELTPEEQETFDDLLYSADLALEAGQLMSPPGDSAYDFLKAALAMQRTSERAKDGLRRLSDRLLSRAREALASGQWETARDQLQAARQADGTHPELNNLAEQVAQGLRNEVRAALEAGDLDRAESLLTDAGNLSPTSPELEILAREIAIARD